ncbi:MAG: nicotinate-nucleotide adenylyltransferase [Clostridiales bacterium]|nr:nicotinate-nucleotide adenylyltransferase [Clostridiales bacterium]
MEDILLLGGTFDPPHFGHIKIAQEVSKKLGIKNILMIPSGNPPHKVGRYVASVDDRVSMLKLAIKNKKNFKISLIEVGRKGYTYTIDTLNELHKKYKCNFYYLIGADVVVQLLSWKKYEELFAICKFVVVMRDGYTKERIEKEVEELSRLYKFDAIVVDVDYINISSTEIRSLVRDGKSVDGLIPKKVEEYIRDNNLYRK